jgi:hypothetical protein
MMFPRARQAHRRTALLGLVSATVLAAAGTVIPTATVTAQGPPPPPPPPLHNVKYSIFAEQPTSVEIYYRDVDPPNWADYSHNPYVFSPNVEANVGPDQQWNLDVALANPDAWAMVTATSGPGAPTNVHCVLAVDGVVVKTHQGPKGALCSVRNW